MKHYGLSISEGSQITNITVAQGTSFPANENTGEMFYRTDLSDLYIYDGTEWTSVGSGAIEPDLYYYTASDTQTAFSGADDNSKVLQYEVGQIQVYVNGVLVDPADYTATNGTSVNLTEGAEAADLISIVALSTWAIAEIDGGTY